MRWPEGHGHGPEWLRRRLPSGTPRRPRGTAGGTAAERHAWRSDEAQAWTHGDLAQPWEDHASEIYDLLLVQHLDRAITALEWFPWRVARPSACSSSLLFGEGPAVRQCAPGRRDECSQLCAAEVVLPSGGGEDAGGDEAGNPQPAVEEVRVSWRTPHLGEVRAVASHPLDPGLAATASETGEAFLFELGGSSRSDGAPAQPAKRLRGHAASCSSVAWSPHDRQQLLTGGSDGCLCLWDAEAPSAGAVPAEKPLWKIQRAHGGGGVGSAAFHPQRRGLVASVGLDGRLCTWDSRDRAAPSTASDAHGGGASALAFSPDASATAGVSLVTGGRDGLVSLWDLRRQADALHKFKPWVTDKKIPWVEKNALDHGIVSLCWFEDRGRVLLVSAGADRCARVWDPSRIGATQDAKSNFPPELAFIHAAHTAPVGALGALGEQRPGGSAPAEGHLVASGDGSGCLHIWQVSASVLLEY